MNDLDPTSRLADMHAALNADLDTILDVDAGLNEVLLAAHHTDLSSDLDQILDLASGLHAIVPASEPASRSDTATIAALSDSTAPAGGAVARLLLGLDTTSRLALRHQPALEALATLFAVARALQPVRHLITLRQLSIEMNGGLDRDFGRAFDDNRDEAGVRAVQRQQAVDLAWHLDRAQNRANEVDRGLGRDLEFARDRALSLARTVGSGLHTHIARGIERDITAAINVAANLACGRLDVGPEVARVVGQVLEGALASDVDLVRSLVSAEGDIADLDRELARARHDFTTADFRGINLARLRLDGLRWSTTTIWPSDDWQLKALRLSTEIEPGLYEIRGGTTYVPTHAG